MNDQFKLDLEYLDLNDMEIGSITIRDVIVAFRKKAHELHPDKAGPASTAAFQDLSNAYQRILTFLVDKERSK